MQLFDGKLKGQLEQVYLDFLNLDIQPTNYIGRYYPDSFSLTKRKGLKTFKGFSGYECTDIKEVEGKMYYMFIKDDRTEIQIYIDDGTGFSLLGTYPFKEGLYERFTVISMMPTGAKKAEGTGSQVKCTDGDYFETTADISQVIASDYIYVYDYVNNPPQDGDGIPGVIKRIAEVDTTNNRLIVETPWDLGDMLRGDNVKFVVYERLGKVVGFVSSDGFMIIHGDGTITKAGLAPVAQYVVMHKGIVCFLDENGYFHHGQGGYNRMYVSAFSNLYTGGFKAMNSFKNYVVLFDDDRVGAIIINYNQDKGFFYPEYINATDSFGLAYKYAHTNFEDSLYFIMHNNRLVSLNLIPTTNDHIAFKFEYQSFYDTWLMGKQVEEINLRNSVDKLQLFVRDGSKTNIYIYDHYYKFWRRYETQHKIVNYIWNKGYYYGSKVFNLDGYDDDGIKYKTNIKIKFGDDSQSVIKYLYFFKIVLGEQTKLDVSGQAKVLLTLQYDGKKQVIELGDLYKMFADEGITTTLGDSLLGTELLGGDIKQNEYDGIKNIRFDLGKYFYIINIDIEGGEDDIIHYYGFLIGYDLLDPSLNEIKYTYTLNANI